MTHEEWLDRVAQAGLEPHGNIMPTHLVLAIRAVVELHNPIIHKGYKDQGFFCDNCEYDYPCPTIQAIEKELK